ncbi:MAG: HAMP domain-containing sensor histidine kinase [Eubacteriales bacterium]|nr:HAMP domain-containing sensor histidine kinase [Eubacteriales bacterium]
MTEIRKQRLTVSLPVLVCVISIIGISSFWQYQYRQAAFEHVSKFCEIIMEDHMEAQEQVLSALKEYHMLEEQEVKGNQFLARYGYGRSELCKGIQWNFFIPSIVLVFLVNGGFLIAVWYLNKRNRMRIAELTSYLEQVNVGAAGTVIQTKEDEFSHLQDEMYKAVTSLYQTREAAVQAKVNFADNLANIAHQLKTPITAAFLSLQLMKSTAPNVYGKQIERQLERLNCLEESLLTLSKIDAGILHLEFSQVDIYTVLNLAAENLNDLLKKENISVDIPDHGCMEIYGDMEWIMEALMNLMKNCMEHSAHGGTIHCDYSSNPLYAEILIWDEGEGFQAEDIPHLFERFYRGKGAAGSGTGIGLSLARSIFELQNGNITARNLRSGGACFEIRIYTHRAVSAVPQKAAVHPPQIHDFEKNIYSH